MRRVTDVLDVWFDSGSMSFAQVHYPFENADWFEHHFPGDFIVEYIGQTRGWFYTMHVLAGAIFDRPAFETCVSHGIVLGNDGQKMSKSLRNYPDVREVFDRDGADAMRWFLMSSRRSCAAATSIVTEQGIRDSVRQVLIPLWNSWYFFSLYANAERPRRHVAHRQQRPDGPLHPGQAARVRRRDDRPAGQLRGRQRVRLDAGVPRRAHQLVHPPLPRAVLGRRTPTRFDTLYTVLETVCRVTAPLMPLTTEEVWRGLTGERSVHLTDWPPVDDLPADDDLVGVDGPRPRRLLGRRPRCARPPACATGSRCRALTVVADADLLRLRVDGRRRAQPQGRRPARRRTRPRRRRTASRRRLTVNARAAGPRLGKDVQPAIKGSKSGDWSVAEDGTVTAGGLALVEGEYALETVAGAADDDTAAGMLPRRRVRRARHRGDARARGRGRRPRPRPRRPAGPQATPGSRSATGSRCRVARPADVLRRGPHPRGPARGGDAGDERVVRRRARGRASRSPGPDRSVEPGLGRAGWMGAMRWTST